MELHGELNSSIAALDDHINDAADAHDASAISILDTAADFDATNVEDALAELQADAEADASALAAHLADAVDAHDASAISILDTAADFTATDVEGALAELQADAEADATALADHLADAVDAHDASAVSYDNTTSGLTATDAQAAIDEVKASIAAGGISVNNIDAKGDLLVGTADNAIDNLPVGTDGQVLTADAAQPMGVKWAAGGGGGASAMPDLTDVEAGPPLSGEAPVYDGAEFVFTDVATQAELDAHINDAADAHDASAISILDTAAQFTGTDVEAVLAEVQDNVDAHLADAADAHDASAISIVDTGAYFTGTDVEAALQELGAGGGGGASTPPPWQIKVYDEATSLAMGDGKIIVCIPSAFNGMNLVDAQAYVTTVSSSGTPTVQIRNVTQAADMLSTKITIDASEFTSYSAATPSVVDAANDDVATGDLIAIDVDVAGTGAKGLGVILSFEAP